MALSNETFQPTHLRNRVQDFLKATDHMDSVGYAIQDTHASVLLRNMAQEDWTSVGLNLQMALTEVRTIAADMDWVRGEDKQRVLDWAAPLYT